MRTLISSLSHGILVISVIACAYIAMRGVPSDPLHPFLPRVVVPSVVSR